MVITVEEIDSCLQLLRETPKVLNRLAAAGIGKSLTARPQPGAWSAVEILAHLHGCGETWTPSVLRMLAEDHPGFREIHPRQKAKKEDYAQLSFETLLEAFSQRRETLLPVITGLPLDAWQRGARINGKTCTVFSHIRRMAAHEAVHLVQIEAALQTAAE
jgi:hypothetical protein